MEETGWKSAIKIGKMLSENSRMNSCDKNGKSDKEKRENEKGNHSFQEFLL